MSDIRDPIVEYLNGADRVAFKGYVQHGKGKRPVRVFVRAEVIVQLAKLLAPVLRDEDPGARGHAFYHYQRPTEPYPCSQCRKTGFHQP